MEISNIIRKDDNIKNNDQKRYYIIDNEGLENRKPNLEWYMKNCDFLDVWIDAGPRDSNDVIDLIMTGANKVVIRPEFLTEKEFIEILEISENIALKLDEDNPELLEMFKKHGGKYIVLPLTLMEKFLHKDLHVLLILPRGYNPNELKVWGYVYERT